MHALHQNQFYVSGKNAMKVPLIVIRLTVIRGGVPLFGLCWKMTSFQHASGMGEVSRMKGARGDLAVALVRQLLQDRIKPEGPKERQEKDGRPSPDPTRTAPPSLSHRGTRTGISVSIEASEDRDCLEAYCLFGVVS